MADKDRAGDLKALGVLVVAVIAVVTPVVNFAKEHEVDKKALNLAKKAAKIGVPTQDALLKEIESLRLSVTYLLDSADDDAEVQRAEDWSRRLDKLEQVVLVSTSDHDLRAAKARVRALRKVIVAAFDEEVAEDEAKGQPKKRGIRRAAGFRTS